MNYMHNMQAMTSNLGFFKLNNNKLNNQDDLNNDVMCLFSRTANVFNEITNNNDKVFRSLDNSYPNKFKA